MTMKELAALAELSQTSVSLILSGKANGKISAKKQAFVRELAARHNYRPNAAAQKLRNGKEYLIGILMPTPRNLFYADMVSLLQKELAELDYMVLFSFWEASEEIEMAVSVLLRHNPDGIISWDENAIPRQSSIPTVIYDLEKPDCDSVVLDFADTARQTVRYALRHGHRKIGYVGRFDSRCESLRRELTAQGLELRNEWFINTPGTIANGAQALEAWRQMPDRPTFMATHEDSLAMGMIFQAAVDGINIPQDLSLIGFNNTPETQYILPPLTTFDPDCATLAHTLIELLLHRIKTPDAPHINRQLPTHLIERRSCSTLTLTLTPNKNKE